MNKFLEYSGTEGRSDTSTASKLLLAIVGQSTHSFPPGGGGGLLPYMAYTRMWSWRGYGFRPLCRYIISHESVLHRVYNFVQVCPKHCA